MKTLAQIANTIFFNRVTTLKQRAIGLSKKDSKTFGSATGRIIRFLGFNLKKLYITQYSCIIVIPC